MPYEQWFGPGSIPKLLSGWPVALGIGPFTFGVAFALRFVPLVGGTDGPYGGGAGGTGGGEPNPCVGGGDWNPDVCAGGCT